mmetsp:Transcript_21010/g.43813  ORF Transcript_21010/g.43813 Transcript_21010/m.43813 type:complete len:282 (-) Transcript_21010:127-972(-)|eukprot:CAMPEP_0197556576 /NCGR_PEP_ID=MMETSP1320-20131121/15398_1 /TAXON_ID=91990 /ORGANISM="Bolidomonas sp., Strain RCC2347" /LENGTH=281 /DNA_ID=CAMNT_0043117715 /DNA_START=225 /DNA_END=1070 /DNA_ORIENTATION=-
MPLIHRNLYLKKKSPTGPARSLKSAQFSHASPPSMSALSSDESDSSSSDRDSGGDLKRTSRQQPLKGRLRKRQSSLDLSQFQSCMDFNDDNSAASDRLRASSLPIPDHLHTHSNDSNDNNDYGHFIEFAPPPPRLSDASYTPSPISSSCSSTFSSSSSMNPGGGAPNTRLLPPYIRDLLWPAAGGSASALPSRPRPRSRFSSSPSSTSSPRSHPPRPALQIAVPRLKPNTTKRSIINPTTPLAIPSIPSLSSSCDSQTPWVGIGLSQSPPDNVEEFARVVA